MANKTRVLFTRAEPALVQRLDEEQVARAQREPGKRFTRADVVRTLLWEALTPQPRDGETPRPEAKGAAK